MLCAHSLTDSLSLALALSLSLSPSLTHSLPVARCAALRCSGRTTPTNDAHSHLPTHTHTSSWPVGWKWVDPIDSPTHHHQPPRSTLGFRVRAHGVLVRARSASTQLPHTRKLNARRTRAVGSAWSIYARRGCGLSFGAGGALLRHFARPPGAWRRFSEA